MKCGQRESDDDPCTCQRVLGHVGPCRCSCGRTWKGKGLPIGHIADEVLPLGPEDADDDFEGPEDDGPEEDDDNDDEDQENAFTIDLNKPER